MNRKAALLLTLSLGLASSLSAQNAYTERMRSYYSRGFAPLGNYPAGDIPIRSSKRLSVGCDANFAQNRQGFQSAQVSITDFNIAPDMVPADFHGKSVKIRYGVSAAGKITDIKLPALPDSIFAKALRASVSSVKVTVGKLDGCPISTSVTLSVKLP